MRIFILRLLRILAKRWSKPVIIDGLWVGAGEVANRAKVRDALTMIRTYDPRRYSRLLKDLDGILVDILPGAIGQFNSSEDFCDLDERFIASATSDKIASVIVHEATHARLWHRGILYGEDIRARVEHVCIRQERLFARKLPDATSDVEELDHRLNAITTDFCSDAVRNRRHVRGMIGALHHLGAPRWLIAVMLKRRRARMRRLRRQVPAIRSHRPTATP